MHPKRIAHFSQFSAQTDGFLDGDAVAPGDQVPAHLKGTARLEADRQGAVCMFLDRLVRVENKRGCIAGNLGIEPQDHVQGLFLERPE